MTIVRTGVSLASAAAVVAITAAAPTVAFANHTGGAKVHCYGVNTCKGTSDCKSGTHDCKGQNDCKGQGFKELSSGACKKAGGSTTAPN